MQKSFGLLVIAVACAATLGFSGSATRAAVACTYAPVLRGYTITQGIGSYAVLARNKETLVRLYLSSPDCAARGSDVKLRAATVTANNGAGSVTVSWPTPPLPTTYPSISAFTAAPAVNSVGDPIFVLPASITAPGSTAAFTLSITARVTGYEYKTSSTATSYTQVTTPISYTAFNGAPMQATVEKQTNAVALLVAKMAKSTAASSTWFSSDADAATARAMSAAARIYPVSSDVTALGGNGGVRWSYNDGLLDLSAPGLASTLDATTQKFCGKGASFPALQTELNGILSVWNTSPINITAGAVAKKIVGVVDQSNSLGSANGCAEGMAALNSSHAWVRALYGSSPDRSGALVAQETLHASGAVPAIRDDNFSENHSPSADGSADVGQPAYRTFNLTTRSYIPDDRTVMKLSGTWLNSNTLFEAPDWAFALCKLGGRAGGDCAAAQSGTEGIGTALAAGPSFCMWGTITGTSVTIGESWLCDNAVQTQEATGGEYWLRLKNGAQTTLPAWRIPVTFGSSSNHHGGGAESPVGTFRFAAPYNLDATEWLICKGPASNPCETVLDQQSAPGTPDITAATTSTPTGTGTPPGGSVSGSKTVNIPAINKTLAAKQDVYFLSDTTASMTGAIANAKANATAFLGKFADRVTDECFGAGDYKDVGDAYIFNNATSFNRCGDVDDPTRRNATSSAISAWTAAGGGDTPEGQWYAIYRWADSQAAFRADSTRTLIWIGDEPAHDPFCGSLVEPPLGFDITEALVTQKLKDQGVTVYPIGVGNLDGAPSQGFYPPTCVSAGTAGQATRLAAATGGTFQNVGPLGTADAIDRALFNKRVVVTPTATCSSGVSLAFTPSTSTVLSGLSTTFNYAASVAAGTAPGNKQCDIKFLVDGADTGLSDVVTLNVSRHEGAYQFVQATVAGTSSSLEGHLTLVCDGREHVIDVEVDGTASGGQTTFVSDTRAACPGGGGTFKWTVTNGVHEDVEPAGSSTLTPPAQPAAISIDYPTDETFLQYENVALHASVLPLGTVGEWFIDGVSRGTGLHVDASPGGAGWSAGPHTITYVVGSLQKTATFNVAADANNNGVPLSVEQLPCVDQSGTGDPDSLQSADAGSLDPDGDGIPTHDDSDPCVAASSQDVVVEMDDILSYVAAEFLRAKLTFRFANARDVDAASLQIEKIAGHDVSGLTIFDAESYGVTSGAGTVRWRRQPINVWLRDHEIKNETVTVTVSGRFKNGVTFRGYDTMRVFLPPF